MDKRSVSSTLNDHAVILPCTKTDFKDFVSSLLGRPQTITKGILKPFEVRHNDIIHLCGLVDQRVAQQNEATLADFNIEIYNDDDSSVNLKSVKEFELYNDIKPRISTGVKVSWTYLIKFIDKTAPEKQLIEIVFRAKSNFIVHSDHIVIPMTYEGRNHSYIAIRIEHTARTWGEDIETLLTNYTESIFRNTPKYKKILSDYNETIGTFTFFVLVASSFLGCFITANYFAGKQKHLTASLMKLQAADALQKKIDFLLDHLIQGVWPRFFFATLVFLIVSIVVSAFLSIWVGTSAGIGEPSFVLLTNKSNDNRAKVLKRADRKLLSFIISLFVSVACGVIANVLFKRYFN